MFDVKETMGLARGNGLYRYSLGRNLIFYGAPGTGKSYGIQKYIRDDLGFTNIDVKISPNVFRTTFYPDYSYSDFVGQIMPQLIEKEKQVVYEFVPGIFTEALSFAAKHPHEPTFLIIEEMSRADCASVFGDIFQLLDRRKGESEYPINHRLIAPFLAREGCKDYLEKYHHKIYLPRNFYLIGTMNTSNQNVYVMDTAFKRRFQMKYVPAKVDCRQNQFDVDLGIKDGRHIIVQWNAMVEVINRVIVDPNEGFGLNEDKQIGQFFITPEQGNIHEQITDKLLQYLWNDIEKVAYNSSFSLFFKGCRSFGELYERSQSGRYYFSPKLISLIQKEDAQMLNREYHREKKSLEERQDDKVAEDSNDE